MIESQWLASDDVQVMLRYLFPSDDATLGLAKEFRPSHRKLRLFACACVRQCWHLLSDSVPCPQCDEYTKRRRDDPVLGNPGHACRTCGQPLGTGRINRSRSAVEVAERFADGMATYPQLGFAISDADACWREMADRHDSPEPERRAALASSWVSPIDSPTGNSTDLIEAIRHVLQYSSPRPFDPNPGQASLLRCIVGNPFRSCSPIPPAILHWHDGLVRQMAQQAYEKRSMPLCHLDPDRLGVLADALEEAGAESLLTDHLRESGPHWRGCHVLDLLLGKK